MKSNQVKIFREDLVLIVVYMTQVFIALLYWP